MINLETLAFAVSSVSYVTTVSQSTHSSYGAYRMNEAV